MCLSAQHLDTVYNTKHRHTAATASHRAMCTQPDERRLWQFLEAVEGWRFTGMGWMVCGPGEGDHPMDSAQVHIYHTILNTKYVLGRRRRLVGVLLANSMRPGLA